ncbi:MAG: TIGR00159 family protein [Chloroflexi bacterium]|nr:TIGR00159 family protein [Chloroflexota bacterium]MBI3732124.1 TIGR00159 family protein [Chloroflexota bacterium]
MSNVIFALNHLDWLSLLDILLVAAVIYAGLYIIRGTPAVQLLRGLLVVVAVTGILTGLLHLTAFSWLIRNALPAVLVAIPVIFQPELRRALERLGRAGRLFDRNYQSDTQRVIAEISRSAASLSNQHVGALIVLEQSTGLQQYVDTGVIINGLVSSELLETIFFKNSALHDMAVIVRGDQIVAAGCMLPLTEKEFLDRQYGTRHRAAIGVTEQSDAISVVVSEETGRISIARNGRMVRNLDESRLRNILQLFMRAGSARRF